MEAINEFTEILNLKEGYPSTSLDLLAAVESRYLRDLKMNIKNSLKSDQLSTKETALLALAVVTNQNNTVLQEHFTALAREAMGSKEEIAESIACASLLSSNNVLYRFRHFTQKESYQKMPAKMRMNIMLNPSMGKEMFELVSLVVSAVNGCEQCVNSHEKSLLDLGCSEERIFDAIRVASVIVSLTKIIY